MTDHPRCYPVTEQEFLEDNIATVAFHLGQPGARLSVSHDGPGLVVNPGEVLKEISRRLGGVAQTARDPQTAFNLGFRAAGGGCHLPPSAEALFQSWLRDGASHAGREREEEIPAASPAQEVPEAYRETVKRVAAVREERLKRLSTALLRIQSLDEKNVPKYAQQIASEALALTSTNRGGGK